MSSIRLAGWPAVVFSTLTAPLPIPSTHSHLKRRFAWQQRISRLRDCSPRLVVPHLRRSRK